MKKIAMDTNFLMTPAQFKVDIFSEIDRIVEEPYKLYTTSSVIEELKTIADGKRRDSASARVALEIIKKNNIEIIESKENTDRFLLKNADKDTIVCTQDKELRKKLQRKKIKIIFMRQKKYLEMK